MSVDTTELRSHSAAVDQQRSYTDYGLDAAGHVASLDDAYGIFCLPFAAMLDDVHASTIALLRGLSESMGTTVANLNKCAETYDTVDQGRAQAMGGASSQLTG
ncbi:type VII secretion target [Nocardia sp. NPDC058633]|uniref:type VII secretion target n=1 Tax=Nocardia sp. NPDC058633 TaxID=3346568 RepID=UPI0036637822